ncbi:prepilin-type N-terminal cleavage/methylation domain-containing protein [Candidatus Peregrinibacteria bacterium]|nr:prepilin-type N-terminal cleavage/methylation domain-containing protein [Candidatus Peregrinibacteria bacterium]
MIKNLLKTVFRKKSKAETLLEVIVALLVLTIGSASATSLIITSIRANQFNKDSLVALNLAQEGIEYMRNLRDSNWIKFSANTKGCWNMKPGLVSCSAAGRIAEAVTDGGYALGFDSTDKIGSKIGKVLNLSDGIDPLEMGYAINYYDIDTTVDSDGLDRNGNGNYKDDDLDYQGSFFANPAAATPVGSTRFYRSISVEYKTIGSGPGWVLSGPTTPDLADVMLVTSNVEWADGSIVHRVKLTSALSSYK